VGEYCAYNGRPHNLTNRKDGRKQPHVAGMMVRSNATDFVHGKIANRRERDANQNAAQS
jgi:hypothetical protein